MLHSQFCEAAQLKEKRHTAPGEQNLAQSCPTKPKNLWVNGDYMIPKKQVDSYEVDCHSMRNPIDPVTGKRDDASRKQGAAHGRCGAKAIELPLGDTPKDKKKVREIAN